LPAFWNGGFASALVVLPTARLPGRIATDAGENGAKSLTIGVAAAPGRSRSRSLRSSPFKAGLLHSSTQVHDQADQEQNEKHQKENLGYPGGRCGDAAEAKYARHQGDYQEYHGVIEHV
jgi:hypothetical protein